MTLSSPAPDRPEPPAALAPAATAPGDASPPQASPPGHRAVSPRGLWLLAAAGVLCGLAGLALAWQSHSRIVRLEQELVRRQQDLQGLSAESRVLSRQAEDSAREAVSKVALLEARVAEVAVQRSQLEDLIQSLARSRDENVLVDIEAALRVAQQQAALTGSAEPLVATLRQADERLSRYNQPRLEGVRRAIGRDIERVRAVGVPDVAQLVIRLDEVVRLADELPLLAAVEQGLPRSAVRAGAAPARSPAQAATPSVAASAPANAAAATGLQLSDGWARTLAFASALADDVIDEARSLVRITRIDQPDALLLAPEQAFFLRENLKLKLLNARLSLLSRQFDAARTELNAVQLLLERYFDAGSRRTVAAIDGVRQVASQSRSVPLPRPDETLAALTTVAGR